MEKTGTTDSLPHLDHYIGIDVGTGSVRACVIDTSGKIIAVATEKIKLWTPKPGYYEQSTTDIWRSICKCVNGALSSFHINPDTVRGIGFDATCSLAVFSHDTDEPISVAGPDFINDSNDRNVILWLDHRPKEETAKINATGHSLLRYVGGKMSIEMEIPKILWLKNHMPSELFDRCKFFDLVDALTHIATGNESRSFCSTICKQGYVPVGVDGSVKGWQEDFYLNIGLDNLVKDNFKRMGGVDAVNGSYFSAGELVGTLSKKAASELGLSTSVAVGSGVIDAYAGWICTVATKVDEELTEVVSSGAKTDISQAFGRLAAVAGTSTCHLVMSKEPIFVNGIWGPYRDVLLPNMWMAEGGQSATGELLKHIIETHPACKEAELLAVSSNQNIHQYLNRHLECMKNDQKAPTLSYLGRHFFFYGDLWGNRSPISDPEMTGSIVGLSSDKSINGMALFYYGAMEFIAMQTRQIIETMNASGHHITSIFMSGSQSDNLVLMQLVSSICDMPVICPKYDDNYEHTHANVARGAAMLGVKAASSDKDGKTEDLWSIMDRMSNSGRITMPSQDRNERALLGVKYKVFLDQCKTQQTYRKLVDEEIGDWGR